MANKTLFKTLVGKLMSATDALNEERSPAYVSSNLVVAPCDEGINLR